MKSTGIVREIDPLGRIVLPKSIRKVYNLKERDGVEIFTDGDSIVLKKYSPFCIFCGEQENLIKYKDKNIYDVLEMTVEEAFDFFENIPKVKNKLQVLLDVGLGYVKLGQSAPTLSGGEAARVKLAKELQKKPTGKSLFILDEPTTGLHTHDIKKLLLILNRIVDNGDTVLVIEHNLDVIKIADHIIDIGPEGGDMGGNIVFEGTPEEIINCKESYTGKFLKELL
jgi:excinuclease ABC subunit A